MAESRRMDQTLTKSRKKGEKNMSEIHGKGKKLRLFMILHENQFVRSMKMTQGRPDSRRVSPAGGWWPVQKGFYT